MEHNDGCLLHFKRGKSPGVGPWWKRKTVLSSDSVFLWVHILCLSSQKGLGLEKKSRGRGGIFNFPHWRLLHFALIEEHFIIYSINIVLFAQVMESASKDFPAVPLRSTEDWSLTWALFFKHFSFSDRRYFYFYFTILYWGIMKVVHLWVRSTAID